MDLFDILKSGTVLGKRKKSSAFSGNLAPREGAKSTKAKVVGISENGLDSFNDERVPVWLQEAILKAGYSTPTDIQRQAFPAINSGYDLVASAATGSGKTFGFFIPMLSVLQRPSNEFARGLIVACTRELALQILRECNHLMSHCSKKFRVRIIDNLASNVKRIDVAICTPLRLVQLLTDGSVSLAATRLVVLDEADKLLDLGFASQIDQILAHCMEQRKSRQTSLQLSFFSATLPPKIAELAKTVMNEPVTVNIGIQGAACSNIAQSLLFTGTEEGKLISFKQLVAKGELTPPALVFVNSKEKAKKLADELVLRGVLADAIHADRSKTERDRCIQAFREGKIWVLVATEVLARGLDFKAVEMVLNYDIPTCAVSYIHRIGRTGRAGRQGRAITFFTLNDKPYLRTIANVITNSGQEVPEWISKVPRHTVRKHRSKSSRSDKSEWTA